MTISVKSKEELTQVEVKEAFVKVLGDVSDLLTAQLGQDSYACHITLVWDKPVIGKPDTYQSIHALTHPENEEVGKACLDRLSNALYEDPFVAGSVLHHTVANFLENNYNTSIGETNNKFGITGEPPEGVN